MLNSVSSASFLQVHLLVEITPHLEPKLKESLGNVILSPLPLLHTRHIPRGLRQKSSNPFNCWPVFSTDSWFTQLLVLFLIYLSQSRYFLNLFFHFTVWISALNSKIFLPPTINIFLGLLLFLLHGMLVLIVFFCLVILKLLYSYWFPKILCHRKHDFPTTCKLSFGTRKPLSRGWGCILESG